MSIERLVWRHSADCRPGGDVPRPVWAHFGECFAIVVTNKPTKFHIFIEDDGWWHETDCRASLLWVKDLKSVVTALEKAKGEIK